jgi:hypothetical protein
MSYSFAIHHVGVMYSQKQNIRIKSSGEDQAKKEKRGKNLSPRNSKACHSISTAPR